MAHWNGIIIQAAMKTNQLSKKQYKELDIAQLFKEKKQKNFCAWNSWEGHQDISTWQGLTETDRQINRGLDTGLHGNLIFASF